MMVLAGLWAPTLTLPEIMPVIPAATATAMISAGHRAEWPLVCGSRQRDRAAGQARSDQLVVPGKRYARARTSYDRSGRTLGGAAAHLGAADQRLRTDHGRCPVSGRHQMLDAQREHWQATFDANPDLYGTGPSEPGAYGAGLFAREQIHDLLELGAGQGRDTIAFLHAGLIVTAMDYAAGAMARLQRVATDARPDDRLTTVVHDARKPLPLPDGGFGAVYSHMLFNMALTTAELETLSGEVHRVLRPGGLHVYTVRHTGDAHYGAGTSHGDSMFGNGGFIVHFFDRALVDRLAVGFTLLGLTPFEEGGLPRRLWRITLRRDDAPRPPPGHSSRPTSRRRR
jgi:SAM-dependent methyltransferase